MIFYTGDIHGDKTKIVQFWRHMNLTAEDAVAILGDAEINYYGDGRDEFLKMDIDRLGITVFCIHGNHEMRRRPFRPTSQNSAAAVRFGTKRTTRTSFSQKTVLSLTSLHLEVIIPLILPNSAMIFSGMSEACPNGGGYK